MNRQIRFISLLSLAALSFFGCAWMRPSVPAELAQTVSFREGRGIPSLEIRLPLWRDLEAARVAAMSANTPQEARVAMQLQDSGWKRYYRVRSECLYGPSDLACFDSSLMHAWQTAFSEDIPRLIAVEHGADMDAYDKWARNKRLGLVEDPVARLTAGR